MRDDELDDALRNAAHADADSALLDRIAGTLQSSSVPVRPLPASWMLVARTLATGALLAVAGGILLGLHGFARMNAVEVVVIFSALLVLLWVAAQVSVAEMIPGSARPLSSRQLVAVTVAAIAALFAALFHDYAMTNYVSQGTRCLIAGLAQAVPVYLTVRYLLSSGFAVDPQAAGLARGVLAGIAGVTMLELHCANFEAPHVIVWHTAVVPLAGALGAWIAVRTRRS